MRLLTRAALRSSLLVLCCAASAVTLGCGLIEAPVFWADADSGPDRIEEDEVDIEGDDTTLETRLIGDYTTIAGLNNIKLRGVGLVVGLKGTGGDPPPTYFRTTVLEQMKKADVPRPNQLLASDSTAIVLIEAELPPLIKQGDTFDVKVMLPPNSEATSLAGGKLLPAQLTEQAIVAGSGVLNGHILAVAQGPIMVNTQADDGANRGTLLSKLREGTILAGAKSTKDRDLSLYLRSDYRSVRMAKRVADRIGIRFHHYNKSGSREPLGEAKTDQLVELKLHPKYRHNYARYLQVVRSIAGNESTVALRLRVQKLKDQILEPDEAQKAALQLEAIGTSTIPILKTALRSPHLECRFYAAEALAFLDDMSGVTVLRDVAREEPAFRIYALSALAATRDAEASVKLKDLLHEDDAEVRYGAFRALTLLDRRDPDVRGIDMEEGKFRMHRIVGPPSSMPMIHLTQQGDSEVVLFGPPPKLESPAALRAGNHVLVTAQAGSRNVTVSRFQVGRPDEVRTVSNQIADVIDACVELGCVYPDIAMMLIQAEAQGNLPGKLEIDALPRSGRMYDRIDPNGGAIGKRVAVGTKHLTPNGFEDTSGRPDRYVAQKRREKRVMQTAAEEQDNRVKPADYEQEAEPEMKSEEEPEAERGSRLNPLNWFSSSLFIERPSPERTRRWFLEDVDLETPYRSHGGII